MRALTDHSPQSLAEQLDAWGINPSHALRILRHLYRTGGLADVQRLRLGPRLTRRLHDELPPRQSRVVARHVSEDGTVKLLVGFDGGGAVEAVLMPLRHPERAAGCVSSQLGCAMGCDFCASTRGGLVRNLTAGEIVEQYLHLREAARDGGRKLASLVFMGMGEPLHNPDAVLESIRRVAGHELGQLGGRHVKVGTVGIVPAMDRLAEADLDVHLAVSLHAADDVTRARIVPPTRRWGVDAVMAATRRFAARTGRIPTLGVCLLDGINDSDEHANALADLVGDLRAHVNLILYNSIGVGISGAMHAAPPLARTQRFLGILRQRGLYARVRRTLGDDVAAACGQLREREVGAPVAPRPSAADAVRELP